LCECRPNDGTGVATTEVKNRAALIARAGVSSSHVARALFQAVTKKQAPAMSACIVPYSIF
jgi:hypothetical protein